jgi:hypothetical protein
MTDQLTRTGANAGITPPVWHGTKPLPRPAEGLAYDYADFATPSGDRFEWTARLDKAKQLLGESRAHLDVLDGYAFPTDPLDTPQSIRDAVDGARKVVFPKRMDLGAPKNEVPNYLPDGTIHPDEVSDRLWTKPSVREELETVLFRLPKDDVRSMNIASIDDALRAAQSFTYDITYQTPTGGTDLPDVAAARKRLDTIEELIDHALQNTGTDTKDAGLWARMGNRFQQLSTGQQRAVVIGSIALAAAGASLVGLAISNEMGD